jgi:hypothetical protein
MCDAQSAQTTSVQRREPAATQEITLSASRSMIRSRIISQPRSHSFSLHCRLAFAVHEWRQVSSGRLAGS